MKILFILAGLPDVTFGENPKEGFFYSLMMRRVSFFEKPLTFPILGALTPKEYSIEVIEGNHRDINYEKDYDLVGISTVTQFASLAYEIADEFRKRDVKVVMGGFHVSALPEEAKQHADAVVVGEAEETWPQLLKDFENGKLKPFYIPTRPVDPTIIPHPRTELYPKGTRIGMQATRGCPYGCGFCSITHTKFGNVFRKRPIDAVIEEIKNIPNKLIIFHDNSLTTDVDYTKELFREMKGLNKRFGGYATIDVLNKDDEFLKLAKEAGCISWYVGFESICQESLDDIGKKTNKVKDYYSAIKKIHDHGMLLEVPFVFGFDYDTLDVFDKTDEFVRKRDIDLPHPLLLVPYPGTPLFKRMENEGRILTKDWRKYSFQPPHQESWKYNYGHVVFQPKNMTPEELEDNTRRLDRKWYSTTRSVPRVVKSMRFGYNAFLQSLGITFYLKMSRYH